MPPFVPSHYRLSLTPDLQDFSFSGTVEITGDLTQSADTVALNALDLAVWRCRFRWADREETCSFSVDPSGEELRIHLPADASGKAVITVEYQGRINDRMAGFYRSRYEKDGQQRFIAVTQFEESDARRALPCLDHPLHKATFDVEMTVDRGLTAISNAAVAEEELLDSGLKRVRFERTPRMSTYLLFFGVGEFDLLNEASDPRVRAAVLPGRAAYAGYGLEFGRQALQYCEAFYRIPYPLPKLDLIAIPDFAFGAMENWGAITFRENLLLHYPNLTSRSGEQRICEVIAHEIAHQWFGNLVTPSDWKFLWLNESFATFFGYGVVDHYHPEWAVWQQFLSGHTESALVRDGLHETFAIEIPGGEHVVINTSTAPIIYSKGGSILRQIKGYIGEAHFRDGLTRYLRQHAYDNAASHHLWEAFEETCDRPVTRMMQSWIEQPGHPVIEVERGGSELMLRQRRFTYLENTSDQLWEIPLGIRLFDRSGGSTVLQTVLTDASGKVALDEDTESYKVNDGQTGFFRVHYKNRVDLQALGGRVRRGDLPPEDRWGLQDDLFALVRSGKADLEAYLEFLSHYAQEDGYLPMSGIAGNLYQSFLVLEEAARARVAAVGKKLLAGLVARIGKEPHAAEPFTTSLLRDIVIWPAVLFGADDLRQFANRQFERLMKSGSVHPDIIKSVLQVGAYGAGDAGAAWLQKRFGIVDSEHERLNLLTAMGCVGQWPVLEKMLDFALDRVPDRNRFIPIAAAAANPKAVVHLWPWYTTHLNRLETFHPMLYERVIAAVVPVAGLHHAQEVNVFFKDYLKRKPQVTDVVKLSLERLEINRRMRARSSSLR